MTGICLLLHTRKKKIFLVITAYTVFDIWSAVRGALAQLIKLHTGMTVCTQEQ